MRIKSETGEILHGLIRDTHTQCIVNVDESGYSKYVQERQRIITLQTEMDSLKTDMTDIKSLLKQLLNK